MSTGLLGCLVDVPPLPEGEPSPGSSETSGSSGPSTTSGLSYTGFVEDTTAAASSGTGESGLVFLSPPDVGEGEDECSLYAQDCPPGSKCTLWSTVEGATTWNAVGCKPLVDDPVGAGEACHVEGWPTSGIDDCERGMFCSLFYAHDDQPICTPFCIGGQTDRDRLFCEDPGRMCVSCGSCSFWACAAVCDPLLQNCPAGEACYELFYKSWVCTADASDDAGAYGDPCEYANACDPGLVCVGTSAVPPGQACEGAMGCCTEVCDLDLGDMQCAGAAEGQVCIPWNERGAAPVGYEDLGICSLPQ